MTSRQPPRQPPPLPPDRLEGYRPSTEHAPHPGPSATGQGGPHGPGQHPQAHYPPPQQRPPHLGAQSHHAGPPRGGTHGGPPRLPPRPPGTGHGRRPPPRKRGIGLAGGLIAAVFVLLAVVAGVAGYLIVAPPVDLIRDQLVAQVKAKTGRTLTIAGPARLEFYPAIAVKLNDVALSPPPGMTGAPTVQMASLDIAVKLLPLLRRQLEVDRLVLHKPVFDLKVDRQGRKSWEFALTDAGPVRVRLAEAARPGTATDARPPAATEEAASARKIAALEQLKLSDVRIDGGTLTYADERSGVRHEVKAIDLKVGLRTIATPLEAKGSLVWAAEKIDIDAKLASVKAILEERPAKLALNVTGRPVAATYDGTVSVKDGVDAEGALSVKAASLRALARWLGSELPPAAGFGALSVAGQLKASGTAASLSSATIALDGATATGNVAVELVQPRPHVKANLKLTELDLNKYITPAGVGAALAPAPRAQPEGRPAPAAPPPAAAPAAPTGDAIEQLLNRNAGPQVRGFTQREGWSNEQINFASLAAADVDAKLSVGKLVFREIKVGQSALTVALKNKVMKTAFDEVQLYQGKGRGFLTLDGTGGTTGVIGANFALDGVQALPLLKDAADMDWLAGAARLNLAVAGQGASQKQIMETLSGKADFTFANGAIVGWNIPGLVRNLQQGKFSGLGKTPTEKTDFSELAASFNIAGGVAQNQDLRLVSPLLRVTGAGKVMLGARQIDYLARPKIVASLDGQGGQQGLSGLEVPVKITGPFEKPKIEPDIGGVLKDPDQAIGAIKEIGKQFKGKNGREILKNLLGR